MIAVRLYRKGRDSHIDSVFYKRGMILDMSNKEILELVKSDYNLSYELSAVNPQW